MNSDPLIKNELVQSTERPLNEDSPSASKAKEFHQPELDLSLNNNIQLTHRSNNLYKNSIPNDINKNEKVETNKLKQNEQIFLNEKNGKSSSTAGQYWTAAGFILINHVIAFLTFFFYRSPSAPLVFATLFSAWLNLLGITAGYHRLWTHNAYKAKVGVRIFLSIIGLMAFQGSIRWWVIRHRLHHRFTDTEFDPYNSKRGLFYSHIGWLFLKPPNYSKISLIGVKDLDNDPVVYYQKKYLLYGYILFGAILPGLVSYYILNDQFLSGVLYIGMVARCLSWHAIFSINSFAHWKGTKEFQSSSSAVSSYWMGFISNGEGYHNYHHTFPMDYRHGFRWYDWDPTKWFISALSLIGWTYDLKKANPETVAQCEIEVLQEELNQKKSSINMPINEKDLPLMSLEEFNKKVKDDGMNLIILDDAVIQIPPSFFLDHPGGSHYLKCYVGRSATEAFNGGLNMHSNAARNQAKMMTIAKIIH